MDANLTCSLIYYYYCYLLSLDASTLTQGPLWVLRWKKWKICLYFILHCNNCTIFVYGIVLEIYALKYKIFNFSAPNHNLTQISTLLGLERTQLVHMKILLPGLDLSYMVMIKRIFIVWNTYGLYTLREKIKIWPLVLWVKWFFLHLNCTPWSCG